MNEFLYEPTKINYPPQGLFSRKQMSELTHISDDVLGYWMKEDLLVSRVQKDRKHRRFHHVQVNIAAILGVMRGHGANVGQLRAVSTILQEYVEAWDRCGADLFNGTHAYSNRDNFIELCQLDNVRRSLIAGKSVATLDHLIADQRSNFGQYTDERNRTTDFEVYLKSYFEFYASGPHANEEQSLEEERSFRHSLSVMEPGDGHKFDMYHKLAMENFVIQHPNVERLDSWYWSIVPLDDANVAIFDEGEMLGANASSPIFDHVSFVGIALSRLIADLWFPRLKLQGYVEGEGVSNDKRECA